MSISDADSAQFSAPGERFSPSFISFLVLCVALAPFAPRAMAFLPALAGLSAFVFLRIKDGRFPALSFAALALCCAPPALGIVSALWAESPAEAAERAIKIAAALVPCALLICAAFHVERSKIPGAAPWLAGAVGVAALAVGTDLAAGMPMLRAVSGAPAQGWFSPSHANRGIILLVLLSFPAAAIVWAGGGNLRRRAGVLFALFAALAFPLAMGESQSAQLGFAAGLSSLTIYPLFRLWRRAALSIFSIAIAAAILGAPWIAKGMFAPLAHQAAQIENGVLREANIAQRLEIWDFVARKALERPLLGHGIEATRGMKLETAQLYFREATVLHPHNFALQLWIEFGILGALSGAIFICFVLWRVLLMPEPSAQFAFAAFIAALSVSATAYGMWQSWWLGALALLAAWCVVAAKAREGGEVSSGSSSSRTFPVDPKAAER